MAKPWLHLMLLSCVGSASCNPDVGSSTDAFIDAGANDAAAPRPDLDWPSWREENVSASEEFDSCGGTMAFTEDGTQWFAWIEREPMGTQVWSAQRGEDGWKRQRLTGDRSLYFYTPLQLQGHGDVVHLVYAGAEFDIDEDLYFQTGTYRLGWTDRVDITGRSDGSGALFQSYPSLAIAADGALAIFFMTSGWDIAGTYELIQFRDVHTVGEPVTLDNHAGHSDSTFDGRGNLHAVLNLATGLRYATNSGGAWRVEDVPLGPEESAGVFSSIAAAPDGDTVHMVWCGHDEFHATVFDTRVTANEFETPVVVADDLQDCSAVQVAIDAAGRILIVFQAGTDIRFTWSEGPSWVFTASREIASNGLLRDLRVEPTTGVPHIVCDKEGDVMHTWLYR